MSNALYKDLSLLRPLTEAAAKPGADVCHCAHGDPMKLVAGPDSFGDYCVLPKGGEFAFYALSDLRLAPLCWVESKPVYAGDTLFCSAPSGKYRPIVVNKLINELVFEFSDNGIAINVFEPRVLTWGKPKIKREGWVNITKMPKQHIVNNDVVVRNAQIWPNEKAAKNRADHYGDVIATVRIEWDEPA